MSNSAGSKDAAGVIVVEPMGNAGRFLAEAAQQLGLRLYAATHKDICETYDPALAGALAGVCLTDLSDTRRALDDMTEFCHRYRVTGVAACWELLTPLVPMLAARLGLPGNDPQLAWAGRNKVAMAEAFRAAGVPHPRWVVVEDVEQAQRAAASQGLGWPLVVKPAEQGGSWGVSVIEGPDQSKEPDGPHGLGAAVSTARRLTRATPHDLELDARVLLQQYIPGDEYSCETVVTDGVAYSMPVVRKVTTTGSRRVETGHTLPAGLSPEMDRLVRRTAARAALAVGVRDGIAHTELKVPPSGRAPVVIETGTRLPGDHLCALVEEATGISEAQAYLRTVTGSLPDVTPLRDEAAAIRFLLPHQDGELEHAHIPETPGARREITARPGEHLFDPIDNSCRIGHVLARAATPEQACRIADQAIATATVRMK